MKAPLITASMYLFCKVALSLFLAQSLTFSTLAQESSLVDSITVGEFLTTRKNALMQTATIPQSTVRSENTRQAVLYRISDALARYTHILYAPVGTLPASVLADLTSIDLTCRQLEGWPLPPYIGTPGYETWADNRAVQIPGDEQPPSSPFGPLNSQQVRRIKSHTRANFVAGLVLGVSLWRMASFVGIR